MDLNLIKKKLDNLNQSKKSSGGGKNLFWKPSVGNKQLGLYLTNTINQYHLQKCFSTMEQVKE